MVNSIATGQDGTRQKLLFVATTPFAVNAFLRTHLLAFSQIYDVTLCVNTQAYPLAEDIARTVKVLHIDIARKFSPWHDLRALFQLFRCIANVQPLVVHSITPKAGLLSMLVGRCLKVPLRFHTFTGQVWATKKGTARFFLKCADRMIAFCASSVFADSASQCRLLEREAIVQSGKMAVMGSGSMAGVDLQRFRPNLDARVALRMRFDVLDQVPLFLFIGRLVEDKGISDLIKAFSILYSKHPSAVLWIVGPDEDGLQARLQALGASCEDRIWWHGSTLEPEAYMMAADVLVLPSYREGFGSVVIEAGASGIPTIAYSIDGIVDAILDQETGRLVPKGDILALAEEMRHMATDNDYRYYLGSQAFLRATSRYSSHAVSAAWLDFYAQALRQEKL